MFDRHPILDRIRLQCDLQNAAIAGLCPLEFLAES